MKMKLYHYFSIYIWLVFNLNSLNISLDYDIDDDLEKVLMAINKYLKVNFINLVITNSIIFLNKLTWNLIQSYYAWLGFPSSSSNSSDATKLSQPWSVVLQKRKQRNRGFHPSVLSKKEDQAIKQTH